MVLPLAMILSGRKLLALKCQCSRAKSQVLSFDVPEVGDYSFSVTARSFDGSDVFEDEFSFTSTSELHPATVRLDHAASETVRVSLRADSNIDSPITAISWQQVSGQNVPSNYIEEDTNPGEISPNLFFAPTVTQDQLLQFRATRRWQMEIT